MHLSISEITDRNAWMDASDEKKLALGNVSHASHYRLIKNRLGDGEIDGAKRFSNFVRRVRFAHGVRSE